MSKACIFLADGFEEIEGLTVVDILTQLKIDEKQSTDNWYYVLDGNGNSGYCMKQYVSIKC